MSYLRYLCLFAYSGIQHVLCGVFSSSCGPYVASFSGLSIFDCPFLSVLSNVYFRIEIYSMYTGFFSSCKKLKHSRKNI